MTETERVGGSGREREREKEIERETDREDHNQIFDPSPLTPDPTSFNHQSLFRVSPCDTLKASNTF